MFTLPGNFQCSHCRVIFNKRGNMMHHIALAWFWVAAQTSGSNYSPDSTPTISLLSGFEIPHIFWKYRILYIVNLVAAMIESGENALGPDCEAKRDHPRFGSLHHRPHCTHSILTISLLLSLVFEIPHRLNCKWFPQWLVRTSWENVRGPDCKTG